MFAKIEISGTIEIVTGLHIGGSSAFSAIGAVDSPVIMDTRSKQPMIPGSSLKGKMRALLAKQYNTVWKATADDDAKCLTDLFGSAKDHKESRILFSDMFLSNLEELKNLGLTGATEVKFENSISRTTAVANPRQIERVVRGAQFPMQLIYEFSNDIDVDTLLQDFKILKEGFRLLEYDYLGGSGSRGYGRIRFLDLEQPGRGMAHQVHDAFDGQHAFIGQAEHADE
jgi:CRISPR-associated protein Csm3